jgi:hypothetical protein
MTKTQTEVFIETNETYSIKRKRIFVRSWCEDCGRKVNMISPSDAALFVCVETETIYSLIDTKQIHSFRLKAETPLVCLRSLFLI